MLVAVNFPALLGLNSFFGGFFGFKNEVDSELFNGESLLTSAPVGRGNGNRFATF